MAKKNTKTDGLGPLEISKIRAAIRQVWQRCHARKLVLDRCKMPKGYARCEKCEQQVPKVYVDHIDAVGEVGWGYVERLFCPSHRLQGLCKECHDKKTSTERRAKKTLADLQSA